MTKLFGGEESEKVRDWVDFVGCCITGFGSNFELAWRAEGLGGKH